MREARPFVERGGSCSLAAGRVAPSGALPAMLVETPHSVNTSDASSGGETVRWFVAGRDQCGEVRISQRQEGMLDDMRSSS